MGKNRTSQWRFFEPHRHIVIQREISMCPMLLCGGYIWKALNEGILMLTETGLFTYNVKHKTYNLYWLFLCGSLCPKIKKF
jgi:hypothetical protein